MDVDDPVRPRVGERRREDLHVAGQHDEVDAVLVEQGRLHLCLLGRLGVRGHGQVEELDAEPRGDVGVVGVVADDEGDVDGQLAGAPAGEEVVQAVRLLRREERDPGRLVGEPQIARASRTARRWERRRRRSPRVRARSRPARTRPAGRTRLRRHPCAARRRRCCRGGGRGSRPPRRRCPADRGTTAGGWRWGRRQAWAAAQSTSATDPHLRPRAAGQGLRALAMMATPGSSRPWSVT